MTHLRLALVLSLLTSSFVYAEEPLPETAPAPKPDNRVFGTNAFAGRTGPKRQDLLNTNGGTPETEKSVLAALQWFKEHQKPDGSWGDKFPEANTALATLAFLGHGETPESKDYGATVDKALAYLATTIGPEGVIKSRNMYCQGIVTLALADAYGLTQSPKLRPPLERAVNAIVAAQKAKKTENVHVGGWRYTPISADSDVSVSGWQIIGLKTAKLAGIPVPDETFDSASKYLWNMYAETGGFGYASPGMGKATTAIGILCEQVMGNGDDKRLQRPLDFCRRQNVNWGADPNTLYGWYYINQAMFQRGEAYWTDWNPKLTKALLKAQTPDGHWDELAGPGKGDPCYSTSLCCLMLEVYYRYPRMAQALSGDVY